MSSKKEWHSPEIKELADISLITEGKQNTNDVEQTVLGFSQGPS